MATAWRDEESEGKGRVFRSDDAKHHQKPWCHDGAVNHELGRFGIGLNDFWNHSTLKPHKIWFWKKLWFDFMRMQIPHFECNLNEMSTRCAYYIPLGDHLKYDLNASFSKSWNEKKLIFKSTFSDYLDRGDSKNRLGRSQIDRFDDLRDVLKIKGMKYSITCTLTFFVFFKHAQKNVHLGSTWKTYWWTSTRWDMNF